LVPAGIWNGTDLEKEPSKIVGNFRNVDKRSDLKNQERH
jgi:hypothetical protein